MWGKGEENFFRRLKKVFLPLPPRFLLSKERLMKMKLLSFCVPTYNGEGHVHLLLESVLSQINDGNRDKVEICVSDNASTDETQTRIFDTLRKYPSAAVRYQRRTSTCDPAEHFVEVVQMAQGLYCGLLGDDDLFLPGKLDYLIEKLEMAQKEGIDAVLTMFDMYSYGAQSKITAPILKGQSADQVFDLSTAEGFYDYFSRLDGSYGNAALFAFISNVVFKREQWLAQTRHEERIRLSSYMQCYRMIDLLRSGSKLLYLHTSYVHRSTSRDNLVAIHGLGFYYRICRDMKELIDLYFYGELKVMLIHELLPRDYDPQLSYAHLEGKRREFQ